jgi:hypothetical protein
MMDDMRKLVDLQARYNRAVKRDICAAMGGFEGDWLQEACGRLAMKRDMPMSELVRVIEETGNGSANIARAVCECLGVTLAGG